MTWIDPAEQAGWDNRRRRATNQYQIGQAQSTFNRGQLTANRGIETGNLAKQYDRMRTRLPGSYAKRGMLNSGIYGQGLQDYGSDRVGAFGQLAQRYASQFGQLDLSDQAATTTYNDNIGDIYDQERIRRSQVAAAIRGI